MTIGPYEIIRPLGKGGMSEVYEATDPRLGTRHAVKVYAHPRDGGEVKERFLTEGKLLAKLSHPRVVKVTDLGTDGPTGRPYFVMDLILDAEGKATSLADIPPGGADEELVARWYDDVREGLGYIHAAGVIHRDLKMQNVLIGPDGHAVLADFGISRIFSPDAKSGTLVDPVLTVADVRDGRVPVMGSVGYLAPEVEMGLKATPASDWYALGVIVYRLLTGMWCDARTDVLSALETYDPVWKRILPKLLHANPAGRACPSFAEEKAKDRAAAELAAEARAEADGRRLRRLRLCAGGALALALALGAALAFSAAKGARTDAALAALEERVALADFDVLFPVPAEATDEDRLDEGGAASVEDYERDRHDLLLLVEKPLARFRAGALDRKGLADALRDIRARILRNGALYESLFPEDYTCNSMDDGEALVDLVSRALKRLEAGGTE